MLVTEAGGAVAIYKTDYTGDAEPIVVTQEEASRNWSDDFVVVAAPPHLIEPFGELLYEAGAVSGPCLRPFDCSVLQSRRR